MSQEGACPQPQLDLCKLSVCVCVSVCAHLCCINIYIAWAVILCHLNRNRLQLNLHYTKIATQIAKELECFSLFLSLSLSFYYDSSAEFAGGAEINAVLAKELDFAQSKHLESKATNSTARICMHTKSFLSPPSPPPSAPSALPCLARAFYCALFYRTLTSLRPLFDIFEMATFRAKMNVDCLFVKLSWLFPLDF